MQIWNQIHTTLLYIFENKQFKMHAIGSWLQWILVCLLTLLPSTFQTPGSKDWSFCLQPWTVVSSLQVSHCLHYTGKTPDIVPAGEDSNSMVPLFWSEGDAVFPVTSLESSKTWRYCCTRSRSSGNEAKSRWGQWILLKESVWQVSNNNSKNMRPGMKKITGLKVKQQPVGGSMNRSN